MISGIASAIKSQTSEVEIVGVQVELYSAVDADFHGESRPVTPLGTVAEGIAVKSPRVHTRPLINKYVHDMLLVGEELVEQAVSPARDRENRG